MKINKSTLMNIIKEEIKEVLAEGWSDDSIQSRVDAAAARAFDVVSLWADKSNISRQEFMDQYEHQGEESIVRGLLSLNNADPQEVEAELDFIEKHI